MDVLDKIKAPVAAEMEQFREVFRKTLYSDNPFRPMLVLLAARMVGEVNEKVIRVALALEMLHTASLVHDDVVDESDRRRGLPSVNALLSNQIAVLAGDFILSKALESAALTEDTRIVRYIAQLGQSLADGELLQLDSQDSEVLSEAVYFDIIGRKTASLFSLCARLGALAAGGSEAEAERLAQYGKLIGYIVISIVAIEFLALGTFFGWLAANSRANTQPMRLYNASIRSIVVHNGGCR